MKKQFTAVIGVSLAALLLLSSCSKKTEQTDNTDDGADAAQTTDVSVQELPFEYRTSGDSAVITGYTGDAADVEIPKTISDSESGSVYTVTEIDAGAFFGNASITSVVIPEGVETVGAGAFQNCGALESVVMPSSLKTIGTRAFFNCQSLADVTFGANVSSVGYMAFSDFFTECPWYASLKDEKVIVGDGVLLKYNGAAPAVFGVGDEVKHVAYYAFLDSKAPTAEFSKSLETIDERAFVGSETLIQLDAECPAVEDAKQYGLNYEIIPAQNAEETEAETESTEAAD